MTSNISKMDSDTEKAVLGYRYNPDRALSPIEVGIMFKKFEVHFGFPVPSNAIFKYGDQIYQIIEDSIQADRCDPEWEQKSQHESIDGNLI
ncbi:MAG: hypothetical protein U9N57_14140 [Pseudomonadota bacterium]|nr:hypothetical protein [Pseudomonadota bacterium]